MFINGIGTANPEQRFTKADCLEAFQNSDWFERLDLRSRFVAQTVLQRDNGIEARRLALANLADVFAINPNTLSKRFYDNAPRLATSAAIRALHAANLDPRDIDAVIVSTCTGYMCPGLSGYVVEGVGLRGDIKTFDLVGQGCAAALPNLQLAQALLSSVSPSSVGECENILSICVEVSSAAMYLDNDPGVIISACLFGDGAGAAVLSRKPAAASRSIRWVDSSSLTDPSERKALMFEQRDGMLRNILTRPVPALAAKHARQVLEAVLSPTGLANSDISAWILHAGGRDVLQAIEQSLDLQPHDLRYSATMLREYGNMSSAFVYFVLGAALADHAPDGWWWLSSFGAGFSCHGALLKVGE